MSGSGGGLATSAGPNGSAPRSGRELSRRKHEDNAVEGSGDTQHSRRVKHSHSHDSLPSAQAELSNVSHASSATTSTGGAGGQQEPTVGTPQAGGGGTDEAFIPEPPAPVGPPPANDPGSALPEVSGGGSCAMEGSGIDGPETSEAGANAFSPLFQGARRHVDKLYVHLDLKGAPPWPAYLKACFEYFKQWGADGLLIEWEDMLPFDGFLRVVRNERCYTQGEVEGILSMAAELELEVIPLVQSFGHLEFVLKHEEFAAYRENPNEWLCLCPLAPGSLELAQELVRQTIRMHPGVTYVHVGCDEVFDLGTCPRCEAKAAEQGTDALFLDFVEGVLDVCAEAQVRALLWHDMFEQFPAHKLTEVLGARGAEPVVWNYGDLSTLSSETMGNLSGAFPGRVWGASAFKGASDPDAVWVPLVRHIQNHVAWLNRSQQYPLCAVILTGWSRFNHTAALCELLPAALPSLAICLATLRNGAYSPELRARVFGELMIGKLADSMVPTMSDFTGGVVTPTFPGGAIFCLLGRVEVVRSLLARAEEQRRVFCPPYTSRPNRRVWRQIASFCANSSAEIVRLHAQLSEELPKVLFPADVEEFIEAKVEQLRVRCDALTSTVLPLLGGSGGYRVPSAGSLASGAASMSAEAAGVAAGEAAALAEETAELGPQAALPPPPGPSGP